MPSNATAGVRHVELHDEHDDNDIVYPEAIPFILVHLSCFTVYWTGISATTAIVGLVLYYVRMFCITGGFHRYFSHRTYKTSRVMQFVLAWIGQASAQRGHLWWAAKHRAHHKYSDTPLDPHSPRQRGFWFAHVGWIFARRDGVCDYGMVSDLTVYPELVWLDRHRFLPAILLAVAVWLWLGWQGLIVSFMMSTVVLYHSTFAINSIAHVMGRKRYITGDDSRNNWLLALVAMGEGWHNNHHYYPTSVRQGFRWWEIDFTYYILKTMSWARLVWELREPPAHVVAGERPIGHQLLDRVAQQVAESFPLQEITDELSTAHRSRLEQLRTDAGEMQAALRRYLGELSLPQLPSFEDIRKRAREMYAETPSLDQVARRTREVIIEWITERLLVLFDDDAALTPA